jgi:hypothetical protein
MERFVTIIPSKKRQRDDTAASGATSPGRAVQVQLQITDLRKVSSIQAMQRQTAALKAASEDGTPKVLLPVLESLNSCFISLEILEETGLGKIMYRLSKHADAAVSSAALALYDRWRADAKQSVLLRERQQRAAAQKSRRPSAASATAAASAPAGPSPQPPFMLQEVNIEREMAVWDTVSARASLLRRAPLSAASSSSVAGTTDLESH